MLIPQRIVTASHAYFNLSNDERFLAGIAEIQNIHN
jgi:hypothetical protein